MTSETESKLLELLEMFEKGNLYNNKGMSYHHFLQAN